jgi:hypothetical protein
MTASPTTTLTNREAIEAEVDRVIEGAAAAGGDFVPTPATQVLDSILSVAMSHDTLCQFYENELYREMGLSGGRPSTNLGDSELNAYVYHVIELCAILTPAAQRRVPSLAVFAEAVAGTGAIESLQGAALEEFMRPIFEESGIGNRFEVRSGYQAFRARTATA